MNLYKNSQFLHFISYYATIDVTFVTYTATDSEYHTKSCSKKQRLMKQLDTVVTFLTSHHDKAIKALYEFVWKLPAIPHQDGGIPLSTFPNGTAGKLPCLFFTLSLICCASSREAVNTNFLNPSV